MSTMLATAPAPSPVTSAAPVRERKRRPLRVRPVKGAARPLRSMTHPRPEDLPPVDPPLPHLRLISLTPRDAAPEEVREVEVDGGELWDTTPLRSLTGPATDPGRVCASILQVGGEAMRGLRPLVQLTRWVDEAIFTELAEYAPQHGARTSVRQRLAPDSTASVLARARVLRIHASRVSLHVTECTALVRDQGRVRAVVVRLEERGTSWRATALHAL